uniref:Restriction endonuclease subunit S n=1 Tax=Candidatus Desulfatibia profunda TaxID=2841695 RepID=A0A8J6NUA9_9BACT|nr:restriction endonuclease subunit S [Candidatus Desulfatibia profunda]
MKWLEYDISQLTDHFISGGTPNTKNQEYWKGDIPWITGADILDGEVTSGRRFINKSAVEESATNIIPAGSILMVTRTGVGKIAIAPTDIAISQDITGIVLKEGIIPQFIISAIKLRMSILLAAQRGATIKGITRNDLKQLKIPLPATSEQRRIVEILDRADRLRKLRANADAKAARILPALFYKMFGDPATNPKGLNTTLIRKLVARVERRDPGDNPNKYFIYIDIAGIDGKRGSISKTQRLLGIDAPSRAKQIVKTNDVLISTVRPYLRATAMIPFDLEGQICSTGFCVLRPRNGIGYGYLYALSRLPWFTKQLNIRARGASYPAVTDRDILNLKIIVTV